jgi:hypothetical protein
LAWVDGYLVSGVSSANSWQIILLEQAFNHMGKQSLNGRFPLGSKSFRCFVVPANQLPKPILTLDNSDGWKPG